MNRVNYSQAIFSYVSRKYHSQKCATHLFQKSIHPGIFYQNASSCFDSLTQRNLRKIISHENPFSLAFQREIEEIQKYGRFFNPISSYDVEFKKVLFFYQKFQEVYNEQTSCYPIVSHVFSLEQPIAHATLFNLLYHECDRDQYELLIESFNGSETSPEDPKVEAYWNPLKKSITLVGGHQPSNEFLSEKTFYWIKGDFPQDKVHFFEGIYPKKGNQIFPKKYLLTLL